MTDVWHTDAADEFTLVLANKSPTLYVPNRHASGRYTYSVDDFGYLQNHRQPPAKDVWQAPDNAAVLHREQTIHCRPERAFNDLSRFILRMTPVSWRLAAA